MSSLARRAVHAGWPSEEQEKGVDVLRLVVPKGSLERQTFELFEAADLAILRSSDVDYRGSIDDERIEDVRVLRPQEIPLYVSSGLFDFGITGRDWIAETQADVVSLGELRYSKTTDRPVQIVIAVHDSTPVRKVEDLRRGRASRPSIRASRSVSWWRGASKLRCCCPMARRRRRSPRSRTPLSRSPRRVVRSKRRACASLRSCSSHTRSSSRIAIPQPIPTKRVRWLRS